MRKGVFLLLLLATAAHGQNQATNAFNEGKAVGSSKTQGLFDSVKSGSGTENIPGYGQEPQEKNYFMGGNGNLGPYGVAKMQSCATSPSDPDPIKRQECEAVNFLAKNPNVRPQFQLSNADSMFQKAKQIAGNAENFLNSLGFNIGNGNLSQCTTRTETTPAQYTTETCSILREVGEQQCTIGRVVNIDADANFQCDKTVTALSSSTRTTSISTPGCTYGRVVNIDADSNFQCEQTINAYETLKCRRGFSPTFGVINNTQQNTVSFDNQVPSWNMATYNTTFEIPNDVTSFTATLSRYQVDNYGQLWINGSKVYENSYPGFPYDIRNGTYGCTSSGGGGEDQSYITCGLKIGNNIYPYGDDGCNWGCRGTNPNLDITSYLRKGTNYITLVCVNAKHIGPCNATISVTTQKTTVTGSTVNNGCAALEARAR